MISSDNRPAWLAMVQYLGANVATVIGLRTGDLWQVYERLSSMVDSVEAVYIGWLLLAPILAAWFEVTGSEKKGRRLRIVGLVINVGVLAPTMTHSPFLSAILLTWNAYVFSQIFLPLRVLMPSARRFPISSTRKPFHRWFLTFGAAVRHLALFGVITTVVVAGYRWTGALDVKLLCLGIGVVCVGLAWPLLRHVGRTAPWTAGIAASGAIAGGLVWPSLTYALAIMAAFLSGLWVFLLSQGEVFGEIMDFFYARPGLLMVTSFISAIIFGTVILTFPASAASGESISFIDALFTATSAVCVTGLVVLRTSVDFSLFGQAVILVLIQLGGLGIMVLSTFGAMLFGRGLGLKGQMAVGELMDVRAPRQMYRLVSFVARTTLLVESLGAVCLTGGYLAEGAGWPEAIWGGVFHSISAFCNAGFALQTDSIQMFSDDPLVLLVFSVLIITGGIGFAVLASLWGWLKGDSRRLGVEARLVVSVSVALLVVGTGLILLLEWSGTLAMMPWPDRPMNAFFQSVTLRTAGFNSVPIDTLGDPVLLIFIVFMFVGGSPGGTAGGIKTTTAAICLGGLRTLGTGEPKVVFFGRQIPQKTVYRSAAIFIIAAGVLFVGCLGLLVTQEGAFMDILFEATSAVGTVGLSTGMTGELDSVGKLIVVVLMLVGRIGPLTIALSITDAKADSANYPESTVMVG